MSWVLSDHDTAPEEDVSAADHDHVSDGDHLVVLDTSESWVICLCSLSSSEDWGISCWIRMEISCCCCDCWRQSWVICTESLVMTWVKLVSLVVTLLTQTSSLRDEDSCSCFSWDTVLVDSCTDQVVEFCF